MNEFVYNLKFISEALDAELIGDPSISVSSIAAITDAKSGDITFLNNRKYQSYLQGTKASAVILNAKDAKLYNGSVNVLIVADVYIAYAKLSALFEQKPNLSSGIHESAILADDVEVASTASIGPGCVLESGVKIGDNCVLHGQNFIGRGAIIGDNCTLHASAYIGHHVQLGQSVIIHPGAVLGADGFGFAFDGKSYVKIAQLGTVVVGSNVEIGANTTIDRGAIDDTEIGDGVRIDNQVQIGHNVTVGEHTIICGCVGIAGSTKIGRYCQIGGGAGIAGHLEIADKVVISAMSGVAQSILNAGFYSSGMPVIENRVWNKSVIRFRQLDELFKRVKRLETKERPIMVKKEQATLAEGDTSPGVMDIDEIKRLLPHRYPFLLVDKVLSYEAGKSLEAIKNVSINEPFFEGHFPETPIMPGVLIIEALAQASGLLAFTDKAGAVETGALYFLASVDKARFKRKVVPGDQLKLRVELMRAKRGVWKFEASAWVGDEMACSCELVNVRKEVNK